MTDFRVRTKNQGRHHRTEAAQAQGEAPAGEPAASDDAVVRRTKDGWRVGSADLPDLTSAMVLADLLSAELATPAAAQGEADTAASAAAPKKTRGRHGKAGMARTAAGRDGTTSETSRHRATIGQLEHALTARIRVEQAIGVLAERHRIQPRQAFEQLRDAARSRGRRVIDIASDVVASATNPLLQLPDELSRPRSGGRRGHRPSGVLGSE